MITFVKGDMFDGDCNVLVNPVNCVGVMGGGLAKIFKNKFPENFKEYYIKCKNGDLTPGKLFIYEEKNKIIINFPTKDHWKNPSCMSYITNGLNYLRQDIITTPPNHYRKIAIPALGCGLGGLDWKDVKKEIIKRLRNLGDLDIIVYEPKE